MKATTPANALHSWLTDSGVLFPRQREDVAKTVARLERAKKTPTEDRVVGGLYFSFWAAILGGKYEELWRHRLARAFPRAPDRKYVAGPINRLVQLRNRVAHHQSVFDRSVGERLEDMRTLTSAVDPRAAAWMTSYSTVESVLRTRPPELSGS